MSVGGVGDQGYATSISLETVRTANEAIKVDGEAANKLLESAANVAKSANSDPERGRIIDIHA